jgi:DNA-binding transcriptional MerR regulator
MGWGNETPAGLTIHQVAAIAGMTPRNVRAHQHRGLLPPPVVRGRQAYYDATHVRRLELVRALQEAGFNLAAIGRLVDVDERYAEELLAISDGLSRPTRWDGVLAEEGLVAISEVDEQALGWMLEAGLLRRAPDGRLVVGSRQAAHASQVLYRAGVPVADIVALERRAVEHARALATAARTLARAADTRPAVVQLITAVLHAALSGALSFEDRPDAAGP